MNTLNEDELEVLETHNGNFEGYTFLIPLDAPLPVDLEASDMGKGTLYDRLEPLNHEQAEEMALVPVSGIELMALQKVWSYLVSNKKVAVLTELPGATYDIVFDQAKKQIGLRSIDWPAIADAVTAREVKQQRTSDKEPWRQSAELVDEELAAPTQDGLKKAKEMLPEPDMSDAD
jgi:hypothetical protein